MRSVIRRAVPAQKRATPARRNVLNDLDGKQWIQETKSIWRQRGLGADHPHAQIEKMHPAPFSFQDVGRLISFFTKSGQIVLDPFAGVGSTLKACALLERIGIGFELSEKWADLAEHRLLTEVGANHGQTVVRGDCRKLLASLEPETIDFIVTSPPYWAILDKVKDYKGQARVNAGLEHNYGDDERDFAKIQPYEKFVEELANYLKLCGSRLKGGQYMACIVSDFKHGNRFYPFHSHLHEAIESETLRLAGITVLEQTHKSLKPYGYPYAYVPNIHHQYILTFRNK